MIKSILVPLFGANKDSLALRLAHQLAAPFGSHIDALHVRPGAREMALATATVEAAGVITQQLWDALGEEGRSLASRAKDAFDVSNKETGVSICDRPSGEDAVTCSYHEVIGDRVEQIVAAARMRDLTVVSRGADPFTLAYGEIGTLLMRSGHPVVVAADEHRSTAAGKIALAWKDSAEAARAVSAAMPYLARAQSVVILSALEDSRHRAEVESGVQRLDRQLRWHRIQTKSRLVEPTHGVAQALIDAALKADCDLVVSGAYGHSRVQEFALGGFTREVLIKSALPILLFH